jgi:hypothetical protein
MKTFDIYVSLIILIKVIFILLAITHLYLKLKHEDNSEFDKNLIAWKEQVEFVFVLLMSLLLIYLFNPRTDRHLTIDRETRVLFFLFGFILLITAKWKEFFEFVKHKLS